MSPTRWRVRVVLLGSFLLSLVVITIAAPETRSVYAIKDAKIYTVSGPVIPRGHLVIRNGLIEAVGGTVTIPPEATIIDGTGLTVYPGLIDSLTDTGLPAPPATTPRQAAIPPAPPAPKNTYESIHQTPMGIYADRLLANEVGPDGKNVEAARNLGITNALAVSRDGILTGQSVLISTGDTKTVVKSPVGLHINPVPVAGGSVGYPATLMGVFAVLRQVSSDASWYQQAWTRFNASPNGIERPPYDPILEATVPVIDRRMPAVFHANWRADITRLVRLAEEMQVRPVIAGGMEAASVASLLKSKDVPVLVSVNFSLQQPKPGVFVGGPFTNGTEAVEYDERGLQALLTNAATLSKAGVRFALASGFSERPQQFLDNVRRTIENGLTIDQALRATTLSAAEILGVGAALGSLEAGKIANVVVARGDPFARDTRIQQVFVDGKLFEPVPDAAGITSNGSQTTSTPNRTAGAVTPPKTIVKPGGYITPTPNEVVIRNATILTVTKGTIKNGSIVIRDGKIAAVGTSVSAAPRAFIIDATGKFVMPGIIDAHSHMAIDGGGNEGWSAVTPNVRIADVIRDDDITIYRALAGGTTTANVLHGSANVIGGTNAVIKLKWGKPSDEFFFGAPPGIKFALGENPKGTNVNSPAPNRRWPATRMGVEETLRESFTMARQYMKQQDEYESARQRGEHVAPPRRDLKLETLADVLRGKILVHAHCYVADEIVMLLDVADEFGFKIRTLQHVLEGYKVAKEIAAHGAGGSTFADFWSPKWEMWDAIPQNAAVMWKYGVNVSINSDSDERGRRLYQEAGKTLRYGHVPENEALKFITINPARQLGVDQRIGSIEVGKDADLAIFSAHPFSVYTTVEMTLVEGQIYFDRQEDLKERQKEATP